MEMYEMMNELGSGCHGVVKLMKHKETKELVAVKFIDRDPKRLDIVTREIVNHVKLTHPGIIQFKEVILSPTQVAIVMEYAASGSLFEVMDTLGNITELMARYFFRQLIVGVDYCHSMQICHRDLKLENILLVGTKFPRLKICDFGCSSPLIVQSRSNLPVGTPEYFAPEVFNSKYDAKLVDVWSCGVVLYVMLFGEFPFGQQTPPDMNSLVQRIKAVDYKIPDSVQISPECRSLISRIFIKDPTKRITVKEIKTHPWFLKNLPKVLTESTRVVSNSDNHQNVYGRKMEDAMKIVRELNSSTMLVKKVLLQKDEEVEALLRKVDENDGGRDRFRRLNRRFRASLSLRA